MMKMIQLFPQVILMIIFILLPYISRKDVVFGVKVPLNIGDKSEINKIKRNFLLSSVLLAIVSLTIQFMNTNKETLVLVMYSYIVVYFIMFIIAYYKMKKIKAKSNWKTSNKVVIDTNFRKQKLIVSPVWYLGYLFVFLASMALIYMKYDSLPDMLRTSVNSAGEITGTMPKDRALLYLMGIQAIIVGLMVLVQITIKSAKQEITSNNVQQSVKRNVAFRYSISMVIYFVGLAVQLSLFITLIFVMGIIRDAKIVTVSVIFLSFIPLVPLLIYGVKYRQDGTSLDEGSAEVIQKDDDKFWKLGMFYCNPNDNSVFVSKRFGIGWTVNHARWQAWVLYLGIILIVIFSLNI